MFLVTACTWVLFFLLCFSIGVFWLMGILFGVAPGRQAYIYAVTRVCVDSLL